MKRGSIPTVNLPKKSLDDPNPSTSRRIIEKKELIPSKVYKNISDLHSKVSKLILKGWSKKPDENSFTLEYFDGKHALPLYYVRIDSNLRFEVASFGWFLPNNHEIYTEHEHSMSFVSVSSLTTELQAYNVCPGLPLSQELPVTDPVDGVSQVTRHTVPFSPDVYRGKSVPYQVSHTKRFFTPKAKPVKEKAPLAGCSKERLIATVQQQRMECKKLKGELSAQEKDISTHSITVNESLEKDILDIIGNTDLKQTPHMELFWKQQKKLLASPKFGRRYHPHLIRFCLSVHAKSPSAYRELASSGVLVLPTTFSNPDLDSARKTSISCLKSLLHSLVVNAMLYYHLMR